MVYRHCGPGNRSRDWIEAMRRQRKRSECHREGGREAVLACAGRRDRAPGDSSCVRSDPRTLPSITALKTPNRTGPIGQVVNEPRDDRGNWNHALLTVVVVKPCTRLLAGVVGSPEMTGVACARRSERTAMGSVGSGVAGEQEFAMKSVGTRTTLPRAPPPARRGPAHRSCSSERPAPAAVASEGTEGTASSDGRSTDRCSTDRCSTDRPQPATASSDSTVSNGDRLASNAAFLNGAGRREGPWGAVAIDACGNNVVLTGEKTSGGPNPQYRDAPGAKADNHNPPKILPVSGKLEQNSAGLVRPSAFKPVVPKSFHSMQNLVGQSGGGRGRGVGGGGAGAPPAPGGHLEQDSPGGGGGGGGGGGRGGGGGGGQGGLSDSGRNSLTSLPTYSGSGSGYAPPHALPPLSASTSHINRLGTAPPPLDKPSYQNGLSASDSGRSSSGKSSSSYQRLSHLGDAPPPLRPSPSSDDIIQDLEDRLWEKEQEVLHMRRNLDQSEAAIVQVFEEKQRVWEREMEELRQNYAARLAQVSRRAQRMQHALQAQIARLQQDKRRLQDEIAALLAHREDLERKCLDYRKEQADILPRLEETKWEVCQKAGEISLLKQQLRESQGEVTQRAGETVALRGQLKEVSAQLREREDLVLGLKDSYSSKSLKLEHCQGELQRTLTEVSLLREKLGGFETEVLGLKQALGELSGDTLLSLQSDEAKAQRQEAEKQEAERREAERREAERREAERRNTERREAELRNTERREAELRNTERREAELRNAERREVERREVEGRQAKLREAELQEAERREAELRNTERREAERREAEQQEAEQQVVEQRDAEHQEAELQESGELRQQLETLQGELRQERQQRQRQSLSFAQERHVWQDEKDRVLQYQAQLQLSYVETLQRNQALELRMGQLNDKLSSSSSSSPASAPPPAALAPCPPLPHPLAPRRGRKA
ncbi:hypothetical protein AAFF_G00065620 [Aldrovandia affinis]|uniref:Leucine zipper tumor suppressor 3 n=1 Tax=Aldrovandia affinis TaxID=143900 RepID=A0AAD7T3V9_9TELE|nr:hypothetical protein AAFF_G00065620 [Aldrovandia affinis]